MFVREIIAARCGQEKVLLGSSGIMLMIMTSPVHVINTIFVPERLKMFGEPRYCSNIKIVAIR